MVCREGGRTVNPSDWETRQLIVRAIDGNRSAMEQLLATFRSYLCRMVAVRMDARLATRIDPSDVVQSVLAKASRKMVTFNRKPELFVAWLRQLTWDELARLRREHVHTGKRSVKREDGDWQGQATDGSLHELANRFAAQQSGPKSRLVRSETRARVQAALAQLAPADREVLVLRFLEQLDIQETAAALAISKAAVKSRQFRAIERLGKLLGTLRAEDYS